MRNTYTIQHPGPNNKRILKQVLLNSLRDYKFPCNIIFITKDEEKKYYAEESNIGKGSLIVCDWEQIVER